MVRFLISVVIFLATAALGLAIAAWVLPDVTVHLTGFVVAVVVFAVAQSILSPFVFSMARKYAPRLLGGIGLVSTLLALWVATLFRDGLAISGVTTWVLAALIVWVVTALGAWVLPLLLLRERSAKD